MKRAPITLTGSECYALLEKLLEKKKTGRQKRTSTRNYCIALLMLDAGLRVGEAVKLKINQLIYNKVAVQAVTITADIAKNNYERTVPLSVRLQEAIQKTYWFWWGDTGVSNKHLFFSRTWPKEGITTRQVERIIRAAAMASISRPIHPHALRHTFATRLMKKVSMRTVQELLGHKHITSTQIYTHPSMGDLRTAITEICNDEGQGSLLNDITGSGGNATNGSDASRTGHDHSEAISTK